MWNKFDIFLFLLIFSVVGGVYGGSLTLPRLFTILLFPNLIILLLNNQCKYIHSFITFFSLWWLYGLFSILWTSDIENAGKELVYYLINFSYFLELISFAKYANNPLRTISLGWVTGFFFTSLIAFWEFATDQHLSVSALKSDSMFNLEYGRVVLRRFASATFGNYNNYVTYICFSFPFLFFFAEEKKKFFIPILGLIAFLIVGYNASRGGFLSLSLFVILYVLFSKSKIGTLIIMLCFSFLLFNNPFEILFSRVESMEDSRLHIWENSLSLWEDSFFIGSGMGSMIESMRNFSTTGILITHNLFLEILVQYGFLIFIPIIFFVVFLFQKVLMLTNDNRKFLVMSSLIAMPFYTIINSGYLLSSSTYAFFASLYIFANYEYIKSDC